MMTGLQPIIIVDTREQKPLTFSRQAVVARGTVPSGADYTVLGYETRIGIERKSIADLVGSLTAGHKRFMRSVDRLMLRRHRLLLVEGPRSHIEDGLYRSMAKPEDILHQVMLLEVRGLPVRFEDDRRRAARTAEQWLRLAWMCAREDDAVGCARWLDSEPRERAQQARQDRRAA